MSIVDFSQADTAWPDFICWPEIAERMGATVRMLVDEIGGSLPYEVVVPAQLGIECCFGPAIILEMTKQAETEAFLKAAELDRSCLARARRAAAVLATTLDVATHR